jgi:hypothetical protein
MTARRRNCTKYIDWLCTSGQVPPDSRPPNHDNGFMFIGHIGIALAAKRATPRASLAWLVMAALLADILWAALVLLGREHAGIRRGVTAVSPVEFRDFPYSHSLAMLAGWGVALGGFYFALLAARRMRQAQYARLIGRTLRPGRWKGDVYAFAILAALVVSHWPLDYVVHRPDLPLYPGSPLYGYNLWNSIAATVAVEFTLYGAGLWIYVRTAPGRSTSNVWAFAAPAALLPVVYIASIAIMPPSAIVLCQATLFGIAVIVIGCWWLDRNRGSRRGRDAGPEHKERRSAAPDFDDA